MCTDPFCQYPNDGHSHEFSYRDEARRRSALRDTPESLHQWHALNEEAYRRPVWYRPSWGDVAKFIVGVGMLYLIVFAYLGGVFS